MAAERRRFDRRAFIPAPATDAPFLPVMEILNDVLKKSSASEPPARDIDGYLTTVRIRRVPDMHALTSATSNGEGADRDATPAPEQPLLTRLTEPQVAELIEEYIDFLDDKMRSVHLGRLFVQHFHNRRDDVLPLMTGVSMLPIVLTNGSVLCGEGLHRETGIVFRISPQVMKLIPSAAECTDVAVAQAFDFLVNEWLVDVSADDIGKAILVTAALTMIERSVLPERPAFFVTAGRRGAGRQPR